MGRFKRMEAQEALGDWSDLIPYVGLRGGATLVWLESRSPGDPLLACSIYDNLLVTCHFLTVVCPPFQPSAPLLSFLHCLFVRSIGYVGYPSWPLSLCVCQAHS